MKGLAALLVVALCSATPIAAAAQTPAPFARTRPIATIDFYGVRTLDAEALRKALPVREGDRMAQNDPAPSQTIRAALDRLPGVKMSSVDAICCAADGGLHLFIGVREGAPLTFRAAPTGTVRLPPAMAAADSAAWDAVFEAISQGRSDEDRSQGHSLSKDPKARALQEKLVSLAASHLVLLRRVLRESADPQQRALAARLLGYAPDPQAVVGDLVRAATDPDSGVRNDAVRALVVFASKTKKPPHIPAASLVDLLNAPAWGDLNKSSMALMVLSTGRDPELLALIRQRALAPLIGMARWRDRDHSQPAYLLLGRIAGLSDQAIQADWDKGDAEAVIAAARRAAGPTSASGPPPG